jgi:hypothetical protein
MIRLYFEMFDYILNRLHSLDALVQSRFGACFGYQLRIYI